MDRRHYRVLLIEDNPGDVRLLREILASVGGASFEVQAVERLEDGLQRMATGAVDVVLLDLSLPDSWGLETFHQLHARAGSVPIVVLTASDDEELAASAVQAGAQDYLVKGQADGHLIARSLRYAVERGRIEEKLRQRAAELAEADRRKDEFLAMLAHELRNPLAPIRNALELLGAGIEGAGAASALEIIQRQVGHMTRLVDDLLDVSRVTRGKIRLQKETLAVEQVVAAAVESCRGLIESRRHTLAVSVGEGLWVEADATRLEQVLVNLLNNAAKYTDPGGRIELVAAADGGQVAVRVRDSGIGMTTEELERAFDLFAQKDLSLARDSGGLGIGLTMVRRLVELHGGSVAASSGGPGRGSEFLVCLPATSAASPQTRLAAEGPRGAARPLRILVVDDNRDAAESVAMLLRLGGDVVEEAYDGLAALEAARSFQPEVVLLDIGLPGLDGFQVARELRGDRGGAEALIVGISGYGQETHRQQSQTSGFDHYLVKPVAPETLLAVLEERRRLRGPGRGTARETAPDLEHPAAGQ